MGRPRGRARARICDSYLATCAPSAESLALAQKTSHRYPEQVIVSLADEPPFCRTMRQITLDNLEEVLEALTGSELVNAVTVDAKTVGWARVALERMLAV